MKKPWSSPDKLDNWLLFHDKLVWSRQNNLQPCKFLFKIPLCGIYYFQTLNHPFHDQGYYIYMVPNFYRQNHKHPDSLSSTKTHPFLSTYLYLALYLFNFQWNSIFRKKEEEETVFSKWGKKNDSLFIKKEKGRLMHKFWKYFPVFTSECVRKRKESKRKKGKNEIKRTR